MTLAYCYCSPAYCFTTLLIWPVKITGALIHPFGSVLSVNHQAKLSLNGLQSRQGFTVSLWTNGFLRGAGYCISDLQKKKFQVFFFSSSMTAILARCVTYPTHYIVMVYTCHWWICFLHSREVKVSLDSCMDPDSERMTNSADVSRFFCYSETARSWCNPTMILTALSCYTLVFDKSAFFPVG